MPYPVAPVVELDIDGTWVDVSERASGPITIRRGRADETARVQPASLSMRLNNDDGALTPRHPMSPWYPHLDRGTTIRASVPGGRALALHGDGSATTPDHASLDITGDLTVGFDGQPDAWEAVGLTDKYLTTGDQRSWGMWVDADRRLVFAWSPDGTFAARITATSTAPLPLGGRLAVRASLDVNNGAGGWTVTIATAPTAAGPWTTLGDPVTGIGTTSVHAGTANLRVGSNVVAGIASLTGHVHSVWVVNAATATTVASPDFAAQPEGTTSFPDAQGRTWTLAGDGTITDQRRRFHGQIGEIVPAWPEGDIGLSRVEVRAAGILRRLTQGAKPIQSTLRRLIGSPVNAALVHAYWSMEDDRDSTSLASPIPGVAPMQIRGEYSLASDSSLPASAPLLNIGSGNNAYMAAPIPQTIAQVPGVKWEVTRFFRIDDPIANPALTQLMAVDTNGRVATWRIGINDTGVFISGRDINETAVVSTNFPSDDRFFDTWAMIVLEVVDDGADVDWTVTLIPVPLGVAFGTNGTFTGNTGVPSAIRNSMTGPPSGISTGHVIVTSGAPLGWLAGADNAWLGETAAHRIWRLCREEGLPLRLIGDATVASEFRGDPLRSPRMGPQGLDTLVELLEEAAAVDGGILAEQIGADGFLYRTAQTLTNQPPRLTLDTAAAGLTGFEPTADDQRLRNDVTVKRPDGSTATHIDEGSVDAYGRYDTQTTRNVESDLHLGGTARWQAHQGSWPEMRYPTVRTDLSVAEQVDPAIIDDWHSLLPGDVTRLAGLPAEHPSATVDQIVEGWSETLTSDRWTAELNCSPAGPWEVAVRDDDTRGRRDTAGTELSTPMTDSATVAEITVTAGPDWTTEAGDYPLDLDIGGEQVTATAIADLGGGPFFAVTRSVNGIVKAHTAGTPVRLWHPATRAP